MYVFCEPSFKTGVRWHVRPVGDDLALFPYGGMPSTYPALFGLDLAGGWDIEAIADMQASVRNLLARNEQAPSDGHVICVACGHTYLQAAVA